MTATHTMILNGTESGAEEWLCPSCGRRMLLRWPPDYQKLVLEHGDETAVHVGGKGGLRVNGAVVAPALTGDVPSAEVPSAEVPSAEVPSAERQWLRDNGIDWDDASALPARRCRVTRQAVPRYPPGGTGVTQPGRTCTRKPSLTAARPSGWLPPGSRKVTAPSIR